MEATLFLKNKINRHIQWNGQNFTFYRYAKNKYGELSSDIECEFNFKGIFHDGGGYGGMLNIELYERDGARIISKMKPMILCSYEDGIDLVIDDWAMIGGDKYKIVGKQDVKNLNIAFEISMEKENADL